MTRRPIALSIFTTLIAATLGLSSSASASADLTPSTQSEVQIPSPPDPPEGYWYVGVVTIDGTLYWKYENANGRILLIPIP